VAPLKSLSGEKTFEIGAELVRQIFRYFEYCFRGTAVHLDNSG
jgi:hypothetical protein